MTKNEMGIFMEQFIVQITLTLLSRFLYDGDRIKLLEFDASVIGGELPIDLHLYIVGSFSQAATSVVRVSLLGIRLDKH